MVDTNRAVSSPCMIVLKISGVQRLKFVVSRIRLNIEIRTITTRLSGLIINNKSNRVKKKTIIPGRSGAAVADNWLPIRNVIPTTRDTNKHIPFHTIGIANNRLKDFLLFSIFFTQ